MSLGPIPARITARRGTESDVLWHRPDELLLAMREDRDSGVLSVAIGAIGLSPVSSSLFSAEKLQSRGMAWLAVDDADVDDVIAAVMDEVPDLWLASPVYKPGSAGMNDLVAPVLSTFIVRPARGVGDRSALIAEIVAEGVSYDEYWSQLVPPLLKFDVPPPGHEPFRLIAAISRLPGVADVQFDWVRLDPLQQWTPPASVDLDRMWSVRTIDLEDAWQTTRGQGAVVAIIDSGFQTDHPALADAFVPASEHAWFSVDHDGHLTADGNVTVDMAADPDAWRWHGTAVAGVVAARVAGGRGPLGIAPECLILPVRVAPMTDATVAAGLAWATLQGAGVVNLSITAAGWSNAVDVAITASDAAGLVICAAAGNDDGTEAEVVYPARHPRVLAVGAVIEGGEAKTVANGREAWASRRGRGLDVVAPGVRIPTVDVEGGAGYNPGNSKLVKIVDRIYPSPDGGDDDGDYVWVFTGTSAAVAHASGLIALMLAERPDLDPSQVRTMVGRSCVLPDGVFTEQRQGLPWCPSMGFGIINAAGAIAQPVPTNEDGDVDTGSQGAERPGYDDPNIESLVASPCDVPDVVVITGYQGRASRTGFTRIYLDASLGEHLEIADGDIVRRDTAAAAGDAATRQRFWVRQGAAGRHTRQRRVTIEPTSFLAGPFTTSAGGREAAASAGDGAWGPEPTTCVTCKSTRNC